MIPNHYVGLALLADSSDSEDDLLPPASTPAPDSPTTARPSFPPPPRGVLATVVLKVAGSASADRHNSASAAIARFSLHDTEHRTPATMAERHPLRPTTRHGSLTATAADYMAFVMALRAVHRHLVQLDVRTDLASVTLLCNNELVVTQLRGESRVRNASLGTLKCVVHSLQTRFHHVAFHTAARTDLRRVHALADCVRTVQVVPTAVSAPFAPVRSGLVDAFVMGVHTRASHDMHEAGVASAFLIDARFLAGIPTVGNSFVRNLNDPYPLSVVTGEVDMTVLGTVDLEVGVSWAVDAADGDGPSPPTRCAWVNVVVVDWLPVQFHFCTTNRSLKLLPDDGSVSIGQLERAPLEAASVPERLRAHPYWKARQPEVGMQ